MPKTTALQRRTLRAYRKSVRADAAVASRRALRAARRVQAANLAARLAARDAAHASQADHEAQVQQARADALFDDVVGDEDSGCTTQSYPDNGVRSQVTGLVLLPATFFFQYQRRRRVTAMLATAPRPMLASIWTTSPST